MKKRNNITYIIVKFYPNFFWQKCDLCGVEFKKEYGWKIKFPTLSRTICNDCAPEINNAEELALTWGTTGCDRPSIRLPKFLRTPR